MSFEVSIADLIQKHLQVEVQVEQGQLRIPVDQLVQIADFLWRSPQCYFDQLSCLTAIDNGVEKGTMDVIYTLNSIPFNHLVQVKIQIPRLTPEGHLPSVPSLSSIWKTADWHEREAFDLLGLQFENHPDLRRILLPEDWEGHPLRKDYVEQTTYHGIQVKLDA